MDSFINKPLTNIELLKWKNTPLKNPRTGYTIKKNGKLYKYINTEYNKNFTEVIREDKTENITKNDFTLENSIDDKDPISLACFWIQEGAIKKIVYTDISKLILYKDSHGLIRCFEIESLEYLKAHNISKHPITAEDIPTEIFNRITAKNLSEERKSISFTSKALEVFQKFSSLSIFIDSEWFVVLSKPLLVKFNYELSDMFKQNFTYQQKKEISNPVLFLKENKDFDELEIEEMRDYLLDQMNGLLDVKKEELKYMCNYLLVGSLSVVIPEIRELYPDFCFNFTV